MIINEKFYFMGTYDKNLNFVGCLKSDQGFLRDVLRDFGVTTLQPDPNVILCSKKYHSD